MLNIRVSELSYGSDHLTILYRSELIEARTVNYEFMKNGGQLPLLYEKESINNQSEDPEIVKLKLEIEKLTLLQRKNELQRSHERDMLGLRNGHKLEMSGSQNQYRLKMKDVDLERKKIELEMKIQELNTLKEKLAERKRREELGASNERDLMKATVVAGGTATAAGAVLGAAAYTGAVGMAAGAAVGGAVLAAPVAGVLAIASGIGWAYKKATSASNP